MRPSPVALTRHALVLALAFLGAGVAAGQQDAHTAASEATLMPLPCTAHGLDAAWADSSAIDCHALSVPENRASPTSRMLRLAVAVAPATAPDPAEPLLYLHGGPGIATLDGLAWRLEAPVWQRLRERHTLVFMDYRGTGASEPAWCPDLEEAVRAIDRENPPDSLRITRTAAAFAACRRTMEADGLDLAGYGSSAMATDAEALRHALGLPPWNVYAVSYGTHVALNLVRAHPEGVRSLILDAAFPPNAPYVDVLRPFAAGLGVLAQRCADDPACAARFPDAEVAFRAAVSRLGAAPLAVAADTSGGRLARTDLVDGTDFARSIWMAMLNPAHIPLVPLALEAGAARDSVALTAWARRFIAPDAFGSNASAQYFAVWCHDGQPRTPEQTEAAALAAHPELRGMIVPGLEAAVCDAWQPHVAPVSAAEAVASDVPALVLTGEFDPITRPADGHLAAATLSRAQALDVPAASHAALYADDCTASLAAAFLAAPTEPLDTACLADRSPLRFVTTGSLADALAPPLAIRNVAIIDVETGERLRDQTVLVEQSRITVIGPAAEIGVPDGATVVDGAGRFLIPGLWDMHAHVLNRWAWTAPLAVASGVTGVRDMASGGPLADVHRIREDVAAGRTVGPRVAAFAGPLVDGEPALFDEYLAVGTEAEARAVVDSLADGGVDLIKVYTRLPRDLFLAIVAQARDRGLPVGGHVPLALTTAEASDAGMWSVEHAYRHRLACADAEEEIRAALRRQIDAQARRDWATYEAIEDSTFRLGIETYSPARCRALGERLARNGTWFVPTLVEMRSRFRPEDPFSPAFDSLFTQPWLRAVPRRLVARWRDEMAFQVGRRAGVADSDAKWEAANADRAREIETRLQMVGDLHWGGAGLLAGTDGAVAFPLVVSGYSVHEELALLVEAGLSPLEALRTATLNPARALGRTDDLGTVAPGKLADLVLLDADPLEDIANTTRIHAVVLDGRLFDRTGLDRLLAAAEAAAQAD